MRPLLILCTAALSCKYASPEAEKPTLTILAASSLTEPLQKVADRWTGKGHPKVSFSFDASSRLAKQIEAGAPVDAFFSADVAWMDYLDGRGLIDASSRRNLLGNSLVAILPVTSSLQITQPSELGLPGVRHLAMAGETVPAGSYAQAALSSLHSWETVKDRVVLGDNVRTVLGWVAMGEADAGVVYHTDAMVEPRVKVAFSFPSSSHPPIIYPAAVVKNAAHSEEAAEFLAWCAGTEGMALFLEAGFGAPPEVK